MSGRSVAGTACARMEMEDIATPNVAQGSTLHLRRIDGGGNPVLFLHGSTLSASVAFCVGFGGDTYLGLFAAAGFDAWCLDFRGYGLSWRPERNAGPVTSTADALQDLSAAVDHILKKTGKSQLDLVGWSWGSTVAAAFATEERTRLRRLVLVAPQWLRNTPSPLLKTPKVLSEAYRVVSPDGMVERWLSSLPPSEQSKLREAGWTGQLLAALADPSTQSGEAPNGPLVEIATRWSADSPMYDPSRITAPLRIIVGSRDPETPPETVRRLYAQVIDHADAQYLEIAGATHFAPVEPCRTEIVKFVKAFLD